MGVGADIREEPAAGNRTRIFGDLGNAGKRPGIAICRGSQHDEAIALSMLRDR
tara:strand:+ start:42469 stop:42627 length:159 start_codon:yes stop_codon:yes gene_type:complete